MSRVRGKWFVLVALLLAFAVLGAACASQDEPGGTIDEDEGDIQMGGTIVVGAEQEPTEGLNTSLACCSLAWGTLIQNQIFEGAYVNMPDFSYAPNIIEGEAELTEDPFTLTYNIKEEAAWNDGTPISADDFAFTQEVYVNPDNKMASRAGYDKITETEIIDEKTVKFTFSEAYAGWKDLFNPVWPKHVLEGQNFNKIFSKAFLTADGEPISSGPWLFSDYKPGESLTLVKNENFWGDHVAYADEVVFRFLPETNTEIQALRGGEVDVIYPQPQLELVPLTTNPDFAIQTNAGTTWEHLDIQLGDKGNPAMKIPEVRQALAYSIDREALVGNLFKDLSPDLEVLNNTIYMANAPEYVPNWETYTFDPAKAEELLSAAGCKKGNDGVQVCDGERLSLDFTSTAGNALRELAFEVIQEQVKAAGFELNADFGDAGVVFGPKGLVGFNFDLFMFAWVGSADPAGSVEIWKCEGSQNYTTYCNDEVTELLEQSDTFLDPTARAEAMNEADRLMSEEVPTIPLYQKPTFLASSIKVHGMEDNPTQESFFWNSEDWWIEQ
jgi:peptide/nickel transport system substrate-binding protein